MKLTVIMPVFNEASTVVQSIKKVLTQRMVDQHKNNMGKGAAVRTALKKIDDGHLIIQ